MDQNELAVYLGCKISNIRMFENGGISIPAWFRDALLWAEKEHAVVSTMNAA